MQYTFLTSSNAQELQVSTVVQVRLQASAESRKSVLSNSHDCGGQSSTENAEHGELMFTPLEKEGAKTRRVDTKASFKNIFKGCSSEDGVLLSMLIVGYLLDTSGLTEDSLYTGKTIVITKIKHSVILFACLR